MVLLLQHNVAIVGFGEIQSGFLLEAAFVLYKFEKGCCLLLF